MLSYLYTAICFCMLMECFAVEKNIYSLFFLP